MGDIQEIDPQPDATAPFREAQELGREIYEGITGGRRSTTRTTRGRSLATTGRTTPVPVRDDSGISGANAGQTVGRRTYTARAKYMEYLDNVNYLRRLERTGDRSENSIIFKRRQDKLAYSSAAADVLQYQEDNANCDAGNSLACNRAGRGDAPTEYASPFRGSEHYNDFDYFGAGGVTRTIPASDTSVAPAPPPPTPAAAEEPAQAPEPAQNPDTSPVEPNANDNINTGESSSVLKPKHREQHDPFSGGGSHSGADGSATHGNHGVEPFDSGSVSKKTERKIKQIDPVKQMLINIQALQNPYGEYKCADGERRLVGSH